MAGRPFHVGIFEQDILPLVLVSRRVFFIPGRELQYFRLFDSVQTRRGGNWISKWYANH